ncbi:MAG: SURF1 family protein [Anaerolineales bacterium]|nr:SURF1 family protein [Anaerolineales bacterium]
MKGRAWLFLGLAIVVAAACIRLGFWQLSRLQERRDRNQEIRAGLQDERIELTEAVSSESVEPFRRIRARGRFDSAHQVVLTARSYQNQSGVHLVTPLRLVESDTAVLVDRGWLPLEERSPEDLDAYSVEGVVEVEGVTLPSQSQPQIFLFPPPPTGTPQDPRTSWPALDVSAISGQIPYHLISVYVAVTEPVPEGASSPIPDPGLELSEGPHLGYAIQWFSFALIALVGGSYWVWRHTHPEAQS